MSKWTNRDVVSYSEAGNMLRHYSSIRVTIISLIFPVCLGILGLILSSGIKKALSIYLLVAEALLFIYGLFLSIFFSLKYDQTRKYLVRIEAGEKVNVYNSITSSRLRDSFNIDAIDRSIIVFGIFLHVIFYIYYFS